MEDKKLASVVVTYYPDRDAITNLKMIAQAVDCLIIVDNTPGGSALPDLDLPNTILLSNNRNVGLAKALNDGVKYAGAMGYKDIFLFDQDSKPDNAFFKNMIRFKEIIENQISNCAFCVPTFYDRNSRSFAKFPLLTSYTIQHKSCKHMKPYYTCKALIAITSGTLISYDRFMEIGPFPEDYFIDFIDNEYCLRAARKGLTVAVNCDIILNHSIGNRTKKRFLAIQFKPNNHPAFRRYYISRNGIRTALLYFQDFKSYAFLILLRLIHEILSIILFENNKSIKINAIISGFMDGILGKMGSCPHQYQ